MAKNKPSNDDVEKRIDRNIQEQYREALSVRLAEIDEGLPTGKEIWTHVIDKVKEAADEVLGKCRKGRNDKTVQDEQVSMWSQQQRKLFLDFRSCENTERRKKIKSQRNQLLKLIQKRI